MKAEPITLEATVDVVGSFAIHHHSGVPIVTVRWDGGIEVNPAFTVDEAARAFWAAVIETNPYREAKP